MFSPILTQANAPDLNWKHHQIEAPHVCRMSGCAFQNDHQAAWCEIDQASTREADKDQDRPARCGWDYIANRGGDQNQTGAKQGLCEPRETGSWGQTRLRDFLFPTHLRGWEGVDSRANEEAVSRYA